MPGFRQNPLDDVLRYIVEAMHSVDDNMTAMAKDTRPFDSKQLTPEQDDLLFHNPSQRYIGQVEPSTGLPYTNAQATQKMLQEMGPSQYVSYVQDYVQRADRRQQQGKEVTDDATANPGMEMAVGTGPGTAPSPDPDPAEWQNP